MSTLDHIAYNMYGTSYSDCTYQQQEIIHNWHNMGDTCRNGKPWDKCDCC